MKPFQYIFHLLSFATRPLRSRALLKKPEERREQQSPYWHTFLPLALICSLMNVLLACANDHVARPHPEEPVTQDPQIKKYKTYFRDLNLPYIEPLGCSKANPCQLVADFNDDGTKDLAKLYEYSGPGNRIGDNYVDLVILYSTEDGAQPTHQIFRHVGAIDKKDQVLIKLEKQDVGKMQLPLGTITLQRPAINVRRDGTTYFPTYYWKGKRFASIDKSAD